MSEHDDDTIEEGPEELMRVYPASENPSPFSGDYEVVWPPERDDEGVERTEPWAKPGGRIPYWTSLTEDADT
jgi:hypothetical protein